MLTVFPGSESGSESGELETKARAQQHKVPSLLMATHWGSEIFLFFWDKTVKSHNQNFSFETRIETQMSPRHFQGTLMLAPSPETGGDGSVAQTVRMEIVPVWCFVARAR